MNARAQRGQIINRRNVILAVTVLILIGLLTFLFIQDSRQHAVVSNSIMQAKTEAKYHPDRMMIALYQAQIAESDRQEAVLFVIGLITVLGTVLAAVHFTSQEQNPTTTSASPRK